VIRNTLSLVANVKTSFSLVIGTLDTRSQAHHQLKVLGLVKIEEVIQQLVRIKFIS